uniref:Uncharacterized protein n=1 Tax=Anopheles atroparvus TaxID=41427 RepID=A0A182JBG5_ANOAO
MSTSTKEDRTKRKHSPVIKQKRKKPHPVRQYFEYENEKQQRCRFCNWITRENATRMVQHIAYRCQNAGHAVRIAMQANLEDAKERESNSSLTEHNKKDIHSLFNPRDNDRKRECLFCGWITIVNLTRMRQHITSICKEVPPETRSRFIKAEGGEECSFRIVNVDDRSEFEIVSCKTLSNINQVDVMDEMSIDNEDDGNQEYQGADEGYIVYGELESEPDQRVEEAGIKKEPAHRQLIAQVIVEGAEIADMEGAEEDENVREEDETENADENVELQEQPDIEYIEVEHRECHWCRTTISAPKEDVWVDRKIFCSNECRSQEQDDQHPKHDVPKKETDIQHENVPEGTRAYKASRWSNENEATFASIIYRDTCFSYVEDCSYEENFFGESQHSLPT